MFPDGLRVLKFLDKKRERRLDLALVYLVYLFDCDLKVSSKIISDPEKKGKGNLIR